MVQANHPVERYGSQYHIRGYPKSKGNGTAHGEQRDASGSEKRTAVECRDEERYRTIVGSVITYSSRDSDSATNENDLQVTKILPSEEGEESATYNYYPGYYYDDEHESHTSDELMNADSNVFDGFGMRTCRERNAARKSHKAKLSGRDTKTEPAVARKKRMSFYSAVGEAFTDSTNHMQRENENSSSPFIQPDLRSRTSNSGNSAESSRKAFTESTNHMQRENENRSSRFTQPDLRSRISNSRNSAEFSRKAFTHSTNHMQRKNENTSSPFIQSDLRSRTSNSRNSAESSSYGSKKPFCSVVGKVDRYPTSRHQSHSFSAKQGHSNCGQNGLSVFDKLHECSKAKDVEGKKRREEIRRTLEERALWRSGEAYRTTEKISLDRATRIYYRGMLHLVEKERRMVQSAEKHNTRYKTLLNLGQMVEYYFAMIDKLD